MTTVECIWNLTRFRADPRKVSVSIRRVGNTYLATVRSLTSMVVEDCITATDPNPSAAIFEALEKAQGEIEGVDLGMEWAYPHPWPTKRRTE
jgi:hypothetical protein